MSILSRPNGQEQLRGILEAQRIAGWHIEETGCHVEGPRVTCRYGMDDALLRRCALRFTGVHTYVVHGGRLSRASRAHDWESRNRVYAALDDFRDWVQREHPDAAEMIWIDTRSALYTPQMGLARSWHWLTITRVRRWADSRPGHSGSIGDTPTSRDRRGAGGSSLLPGRPSAARACRGPVDPGRRPSRCHDGANARSRGHREPDGGRLAPDCLPNCRPDAISRRQRESSSSSTVAE